MLIHAPSWVAYACVDAGNYLWLYTAVRIFQHVVGVGLNTSYANISFVNLPQEDQTNYFSFYMLVNSLSAFAGMMVGTGLVAWIGERALFLFGLRFSSVQILLLIQALGNVLVPLFIFSRFRILDPDARTALKG